ncbi:lysylphosphatidylglycerol synthase domain-containing protein [Allonocardiopsis opalescens]|uniref:Lysylphosphatidylglycerol synthase-like protein n=1 Tax=Allonocardiopsis opalescens TaxID=1144618 RepID=A0A2T0QC52_9ACTN|nr:lysylphosphatidylglycerol synthase domain-containing protein [Allonocardiopsis opalescens]PRY01478.1 hypothetical protein CLV72_10160 [Allonocardiopsis opalescens]
MVRRLRALPWLRAALAAALLGFAGYALAANWAEAGAALTRLSPWTVLGAVLAALAALVCQVLAWRALLADLGAPLPVAAAGRIWGLGQLGKYVPGMVWAFVAQVELAKEHDVARSRSLAASVLAFAVTLAVNVMVAAATLPFTSAEAAGRWWWLVLLVPVLLACLHPRLIAWGVRTGLRLLRRPPVDVAASPRGLARAVLWTLAAWVPLSLHAWLLVAGVGGGSAPGTWPLAAGAYALAWSLGLVVVFAPAGLGVRELALAVALAPVLPEGAALVVAGLSRLVMTAADLGGAGIALALRRTPSTHSPTGAAGTD